MKNPDIDKASEALQAVIVQHEAATAAYTLANSNWLEAAAKGDNVSAEKIETERDTAQRLMQRLEVQRLALAKNLDDAEELGRIEHAAKLKQQADAILARASKGIANIEPLAATLTKAVDELELNLSTWKEARYFAKQAGANCDGFDSQENEALVSRIIDALTLAKIRAANIAKEFSKVSVFN
ncbi:MAG: hypothetical protein ACT4OH_06175 [Methylophilaceae bacterium]